MWRICGERGEEEQLPEVHRDGGGAERRGRGRGTGRGSEPGEVGLSGAGVEGFRRLVETAF